MDEVDGICHFICYITVIYILRRFEGDVREVLMASELQVCSQGEIKNRYRYSRIQINAANTVVNKLNIDT